MTSIVIKLVDKSKPDQAAQAKAELQAGGYQIVYEHQVDMIGVDATKHGGGDEKYGAGYVIIGKK